MYKCSFCQIDWTPANAVSIQLNKHLTSFQSNYNPPTPGPTPIPLFFFSIVKTKICESRSVVITTLAPNECLRQTVVCTMDCPSFWFLFQLHMVFKTLVDGGRGVLGRLGSIETEYTKPPLCVCVLGGGGVTNWSLMSGKNIWVCVFLAHELTYSLLRLLYKLPHNFLLSGTEISIYNINFYSAKCTRNSNH